MVYFLSDAHLGSRAIEDGAEHQKKVVDLLNQMSKDATAIYLLGDIFDFWYEYIWPDKSKEQFTPVLDCLKHLTNQGIAVHYFIGNHDIWTWGWLEKRTGVIIHKEPLSTTIHDKRVYMGHGDGLVPKTYLQHLDEKMQKKIRAFIRLRAFFHNPIPQFLFRLLPPQWGNEFGYEWARRSRLKELAHPCAYKGENQEELVLFAKEMEGYDYYIFGHRHIELDLMIRANARVIILGDMFKLWTYGAMDEKGMFELKVVN